MCDRLKRKGIEFNEIFVLVAAPAPANEPTECAAPVVANGMVQCPSAVNGIVPVGQSCFVFCMGGYTASDPSMMVSQCTVDQPIMMVTECIAG